MKPRIRWTCPQCNHDYGVVSTEGLTVCPACKESQQAPDIQPETPSIPYVSVIAKSRRSSSSVSFSELLDLRFERYLTPWIVRLTWCIVIAIGCILICATILENVYFAINGHSLFYIPPRDGPRIAIGNDSIAKHALTMLKTIACVFGITLGVLYTRVLLEAVIVIFNIATSVSKIRTIAEGVSRRGA